jgi:L,D-peptidoglycan transpeptidase YkuD (ErfK/YbiS/YcfS/YnhG family)
VIAALVPGAVPHAAELHCLGESFRAAIGRNGISNEKREGDGATPAGLLPLRQVLYRPDRLARPQSRLLTAALAENDGWCDDAAHPAYNRLIALPHPARHEALWRDDALYDLIGVLGWNDSVIVPGRGSAIFLHVATPDYAATEGCIALALPDLLRLLAAGLEAILVPGT